MEVEICNIFWYNNNNNTSVQQEHKPKRKSLSKPRHVSSFCTATEKIKSWGAGDKFITSLNQRGKSVRSPELQPSHTMSLKNANCDSKGRREESESGVDSAGKWPACGRLDDQKFYIVRMWGSCVIHYELHCVAPEDKKDYFKTSSLSSFLSSWWSFSLPRPTPSPVAYYNLYSFIYLFWCNNKPKKDMEEDMKPEET